MIKQGQNSSVPPESFSNSVAEVLRRGLSDQVWGGGGVGEGFWEKVGVELALV